MLLPQIEIEQAYYYFEGCKGKIDFWMLNSIIDVVRVLVDAKSIKK